MGNGSKGSLAVNPIICGRRNCAVCGRWKLVIDFRWRWRKNRTNRTRRYPTPFIDTVCTACRRRQSREAYQALTPEQKKAKGIRANKMAARRRNLLREQIDYAKLSYERQRKLEDDEEVDFVPFRMWLLGHLRYTGATVSSLAAELNCDSKRVERWTHGYEWTRSSCDPTPIRYIRISTVDEVGVALGDAGLLYRLYPYAD